MLIQVRVQLPHLRIASRCTVTLPSFDSCVETLPVLWLLPEEGTLASSWMRKADMEAVSEEYGIAVVMPEGLHSDWEDMVRGLDWYSYLTKDLTAHFHDTFGITLDPERSFIFGTGSGGLGAVRTALKKGIRVKAAGSFDTDFNIFSPDERHSTPEFVHKMETIYGDDFRSDENAEKACPYRLAMKAEDPPAFVILTGENSENSAISEGYAAFLEKNGIPVIGKQISSGKEEDALRSFLDAVL